VVEKINFSPKEMVFHLLSKSTLNLHDNKVFFLIAKQPAHAAEVNIVSVTIMNRKKTKELLDWLNSLSLNIKKMEQICHAIRIFLFYYF